MIGRVVALLAALVWAVPAAAQCPPSAITVEVVAGSVPGCVDATPAAEKPELNVTNNCEEDQFHIEAGADCPNCGPPLTLRSGTFGAFIVESRPLTAFTPQSSTSDHVLTWAGGNARGDLTVRVLPNIVPCPEPDLGGEADIGPTMAMDPDPVERVGGCATRGALGHWFTLVSLVVAWGVRKRLTFEVRAGSVPPPWRHGKF